MPAVRTALAVSAAIITAIPALAFVAAAVALDLPVDGPLLLFGKLYGHTARYRIGRSCGCLAFFNSFAVGSGLPSNLVFLPVDVLEELPFFTGDIRDGNIKVSIWVNDGGNGPFPSVTLERTYKDEDGKFHSSNSMSGREILVAMHLLDRAYARQNRIRTELKLRTEDEE